ncbi:hypothetical protein H1R20_g924, partial [Candolleomyces eurysporus]
MEASRDTLDRLKSPGPCTKDFDDQTRLHLKMYISHMKTSQDIYQQNREAFNEFCPEGEIPSFEMLEKKALELTSISTITDDMCINSCYAFTGDFADQDTYTICGADCYIGTGKKKQARKTMTTIPLGPQLVALRQSKEGSEALQYRHTKTQEVLEDLHNEQEYNYNNIFCGSDYIELAQELELTEDDFVVSLSLDGAQLYQSKKSDTWIGIWIVHDYDPST